MKTLFFGNRCVGFLKLGLNAIAVPENYILVIVELQAGKFAATMPLGLSPEELSPFLQQLAKLDQTLKGSATLQTSKSPEWPRNHFTE